MKTMSISPGTLETFSKTKLEVLFEPSGNPRDINMTPPCVCSVSNTRTGESQTTLYFVGESQKKQLSNSVYL